MARGVPPAMKMVQISLPTAHCPLLTIFTTNDSKPQANPISILANSMPKNQCPKTGAEKECGYGMRKAGRNSWMGNINPWYGFSSKRKTASSASTKMNHPSFGGMV